MTACGPFERHIRDAIALNVSRAPLYVAMSGGASRSISRRLILAERVLLPVARWFDRQAEPYHRAGIPLLEAIFVSMETAPVFGSTQAVRADAATRQPHVSAIRRRLRSAFRAGGFEAVANALSAELTALAVTPNHECLLRHLLESARRIAVLAPAQIDSAREHRLASPRWLLVLLLRMHLWGLGLAASLDARARPLQMRGIPILAQDLPPIPVP